MYEILVIPIILLLDIKDAMSHNACGVVIFEGNFFQVDMRLFQQDNSFSSQLTQLQKEL